MVDLCTSGLEFGILATYRLKMTGTGWLAVQMAPNIPPYEPYEARTCCNGPQEALQWLLKQQVLQH